MAFNVKQGSTSLNIQATTSATTQPMSTSSTNVSVVANPVTHASVSQNNVLAVSSNIGTRKQKTKNTQLTTSWKVFDSVPTSAVTSPPTDTGTAEVVEDNSEVDLYVPPPPEPEDYAAASTKDELTVESLEGITSFLKDASLSSLRPELLGSLEWLPARDDRGYRTAVNDMIDLRWTMRQLSIENVTETLKNLDEWEWSSNGDSLVDISKRVSEYYDKNSQSTIDAAFEVVSILSMAKNSLDIKDNEEALAPLIARILDEKLPRTTSTDVDTSVRSLFINSLRFSEEGYDEFSNSKVINQVLRDLMYAVYNHSPMLIGEKNFDRSDDLDALKINRNSIPRHRKYKLRPYSLSSSSRRQEARQFNPAVYSKYSSFLSSLPIDDEDRFKVLVNMFSRELTLSAGLGLTEETTLGQRFESPSRRAVYNALGYPRDNILDDVRADGSLSDFVLVNESKGEEQTGTVTRRGKKYTWKKTIRKGATSDNRTILPFETRIFTDTKGRRAVPGSIALVDNITGFGDIEAGFDTSAYVDFAKSFKDTTDDAVDFVEKMMNLEDEEYKLQPQTVFSSLISRLKDVIPGLTSTMGRVNELQATMAGVMVLCRTDQELRHLVFRYLLELRDITEAMQSDTSMDVSGSGASSSSSGQFESRIRAARQAVQKYGDVAYDMIARNLGITTAEVKRLMAKDKPGNPLSHTAMSIAKKVYELAEEFPDGTTPNTRNLAKIGRSAIYSHLISASHSISSANNIFGVILNYVNETEESALALATRNNGTGTYLNDENLTKMNKWDGDVFVMMIFEMFVSLFSRHVTSNVYKTETQLWILYDGDKNKRLIDAIENVLAIKLAESAIATSEMADDGDDLDESSADSNAAAGALSQGAAMKDLSGENSDAAFSDLQTFMTEFEQEVTFIHHLNSILQAVASTLETSAEQLESFFNAEASYPSASYEVNRWRKSELGRKFIQSLSTQQLKLLNVAYYKYRPREGDTSYLPSSQTISAEEVSALRSFVNEAKMGGRTGSNIRVFPIGLPSGLLATLINPPYTIGTKEPTELHENKNVVEVHMYKRDLEYEDIVFKPKKFLFDMSLFMMPEAFKGVDVSYGPDSRGILRHHSFENIIRNDAEFSYFSAARDDDTDDFESKKSYEILEDGTYDFLGSGAAEKLLVNHTSNRLLQLYYRLLFGLEMDELTFMYDDAWLDMFIDGQGLNTLRLCEGNSSTAWWVRNGAVPINNLVSHKHIDDVHVGYNVSTIDDAKSWLKNRYFPSASAAYAWWNKDKTSKYRKKKYRSKYQNRSRSTSYAPTPRRYGYGARRWRVPPLLKSQDLNRFRTLASSTIFTAGATKYKFMAPKLFDRVFMIAIDPDDFEIDVDATVESFGGQEFISKDFFSEISEDIQADDGRIVKKLKPRRKGENYSSFNDFFVTISTPTIGEV